MSDLSAVAAGYFKSHPEARDGVLKAWYAWFAGPEDGHWFRTSKRDCPCRWCFRTREQVRHDDLPGACLSRPDIAGTVLAEEEKAAQLLVKARKLVPKVMEQRGMGGAALAFLHQTHGIDPETVGMLMTVPADCMAEYRSLMDSASEQSRSRQVREAIGT